MKAVGDSPQIKALLARVRELDAQSSRLMDEVEQLRQDASPFKVGDKVMAYRRQGYEEAVIMDVQATYWGTYWYRVGWRKKDGKFGRQNHRVFNNVRPYLAAPE